MHTEPEASGSNGAVDVDKIRVSVWKTDTSGQLVAG
jgi:hypothetical protein